MEKKIFKLHIDKSINVDIDTTDFKTVDFDKIYNEVKENLNALKILMCLTKIENPGGNNND